MSIFQDTAVDRLIDRFNFDFSFRLKKFLLVNDRAVVVLNGQLFEASILRPMLLFIMRNAAFSDQFVY